MTKVNDNGFSELSIGWDRKKLSELGETYSGLSGKTKEDFENGNYQMIAYMDVYGNTFIYEPSASVFIDRDENQNSINYGDILFTTSSETPDEVAISSVYLGKSNNPIFLNSFCFGYRFTELEYMNPLFYGYYFRSDYFRSLTFKLAQGSTRFNISKNKLIESTIHIPPVKEQEKIAEILLTVDTQIEQTEQIIEQTKELKHGLMQQLLTKGIGHTEFKESELGRIPKEWNIFSFNQLTDRITVGIATSSSKHYVKNGIPMIRNQNIKKNFIDKKDLLFISKEFDEENKNKRLLIGDILTVRTGYPGQSAVVTEEFEKAQSFTTLISTPKKEKINSYFISYYINSQYGMNQLNSMAAGGAQKNLNAASLKTLKLPVPSLEEQQKIAEVLSSVDKQIDLYEQEKAKYEEIKKGLMQQLLTGKIRVKVDE